MFRALFLLACLFAPLTDWERVVSDECSFVAEFPARVNTRVFPVHGTSSHYAYFAYPDSGRYEMKYEVYCYALEADVSEAPDLEGWLDRMAPDSEPMSFLGHSARIKREQSDGLQVRRIQFAAGHHFYLMYAADRPSEHDRVERFFNSLELARD